MVHVRELYVGHGGELHGSYQTLRGGMCVSTCGQCYGVILFYILTSESDVINGFTPARHGGIFPRGQAPEYLTYHRLT